MPTKAASETLSPELLRELTTAVRERYLTFTSGLPFHGWHHVEFVRSQAVVYAKRNGADISIVESAALLHDLNYMVARNSRASAGQNLRAQILRELGVPEGTVNWIEQVVREAETEARDSRASLEAQALSDADTIFKALPITPVMLAPLYMEETGRSLKELCEQIVNYQVPLYEQGIYFYDDRVRDQYNQWAAVNLRLWECIRDSLDHAEVQDLVAMLEGARK